MDKVSKLFIICCLWLIPAVVYAESLGDLLIDLRYRTGEVATSESNYADSVAIGWINMAQSRVVKLGGYLPKSVDYVYEGDSNYVHLPPDFRAITQLKVKSEGRWFGDSSILGDVDWIDEDSAELVLAVAAFAERHHDIKYATDSNEYPLPSDFREVNAVLVLRDGEWWGALPNPGLVNDTDVLSYAVHQHDIDSASIYLEGVIPIIERSFDFTYVAYSNEYLLPSDFREVSAVMVLRDGSWIGAIPNPGLTQDTGIFNYTVHQALVDSASVYLKGFLPGIDRRHDIVSENGVSTYQLPADFREIASVMIHSNGKWWAALANPSLVNDTDVFSYTVNQHGIDSSDVYIKGEDLLAGDTIRVTYRGGLRAGDVIKVVYRGGLLADDTIRVIYQGALRDDDTIRVIYQGALRDGDTLRVEYLAAATSMGTDTNAICQVPTDLQGFIVEEALGYYYGYLRMFQQQALIWQWVRIDMGVARPEGQ